MKQVLILKGLPASGKTTFAKQWQKSGGKVKRINKDDLRGMLDDGKWSGTNEKFIIKARDALIMLALEEGCHVVVDDTNLDPKHEEHIRELVKGQAEVKVQTFFDASVEECIKRDLKRSKSVGEKVIKEMYGKYLEPKPELYAPDPALPPAIICDIDGTLAKMGDRSPFDWAKVSVDAIHEHVKELINMYWLNKGVKVILVSGRDGSCKEQTEKWLDNNYISYNELYMREAGNTENDAIIKRRIFDEYIRDKYRVLFVLDDRDRVVKMWRSLGLKCLQVADGNF